MPIFNKFAGIRPLVDGMVDSEYHNCVPTGESVVERTNYERIEGGGLVSFSCRIGIDNVFSLADHDEINIAKNIWRATDGVNFLKGIQIGDTCVSLYITNPAYVDLTQADNTKLWFPRLYIVLHEVNESSIAGRTCWSTPILFAWNGFEIDPETISICISGTNPRYLFIGLEGCATYWINLEDTRIKSGSEYGYQTARYLGCLANPQVFDPTLADTGDTSDAAFTYAADFYMAASLLENRQSTAFNNVDWYDNKLVISYNNAVWMTKTDPTSLFVADEDGEYTYNWKRYGVDNMWTNAYKSTLSYDKLWQVRSCYGQLFFINEKSIEMWTRSGNESDPMNPVSTYVTNVDVVKCDVVGGRMIAIIYEDGKLRIALLDSQGNATKISNQAIDKRLGSASELTYNRVTTIVQNNESHIAWYKIGSTTTKFICFNPNVNAWYTLEYSNSYAPICHFGKYAINGKYGFLRQINICKDNGDKYERCIKDVYQQFTQRRIINGIEIYGQFALGDVVENNDKIILQTSTTQGATWSREFERTPPRLGQFQPKIVFNGLGSGENFMLKLKWFNQKPYVINGINLNVR